jgi:hypothetical protein
VLILRSRDRGAVDRDHAGLPLSKPLDGLPHAEPGPDLDVFVVVQDCNVEALPGGPDVDPRPAGRVEGHLNTRQALTVR